MQRLEAFAVDVGGGTTSFELAFHEFHVGGDVAEIALIAGTKVVETGLTVSGEGKPVFRALSVAGEKIFAVLALSGQFGVFVHAKLLLPVAIHHLN